MKKKLLRLVFVSGLFTTFSGVISGQQQIPNSGFENWENVGSNTEEPLNWNSNKTGTGNATLPPKTISRESSIVHSGTYSAKIKTESYFGTPVNGVMTTGRVNAPTFTASDGYNDTRTDNNDFNCPLTDYPDSIVFWAHYTQGDGSDRARVAVTIHDNYNQRDPYANDPNGSQNVVANATLNFPTTNGWQRISVPFDYASYTANNKVPAYVLVNLTSSNVPGAGSTSSILYVDDLELIYNPNVNSISPQAVQNLLINSPGTQLTVTETPNAASANAIITREWKFSTTSGTGYQSFATAQTGVTYTPIFASVGTYYVVCESTFGPDVVVSNEVIVNVTEEIPNVATIAPTAVQNIEINQEGTTLTVTETPSAAGSREWKFSTTSGSGYMSFPSDEFGLTYTPLFAAAGTYYVVCESDFNGEFVLSNEVTVNVTENATNTVQISPAMTQNIEVNEPGTVLTATEGPNAATSREWKFSTTSGTGYQSFATAQTGVTYTPLFAAAGTYYVVCESDFNGDFVVSNEVQINVSPASGGLNEELIQVVLFQKDNQLVVDLTAAAIENTVFHLISMDGKTVANVKMNAKTSNLVQIDFAPGVYIYQLSNGQTRVDGKIMIK
jgi:plastocyanin